MSDLSDQLDEIANFVSELEMSNPGTVVHVNINVNVGGEVQAKPGDPVDPSDPGDPVDPPANDPRYRVDATRDPNKRNNKVKVRSNPDPSSGEFAHVVTGDIVVGTGLTHRAAGVHFTQIKSPYSGWVESLFLVAL